MDIEHCDGLSWISRSTKAMRKTARHCPLQPRRNPKQHPAILPWLSNFRVATGDNRPVSNWQRIGCLVNGGVAPQRANTPLRKRSTTDPEPLNE
jgi:hypothetical protein